MARAVLPTREGDGEQTRGEPTLRRRPCRSSAVIASRERDMRSLYLSSPAARRHRAPSARSRGMGDLAADGPFAADNRRAARTAARRARDPARGTRGRRPLAARTDPFLARAPDSRAERGPRVCDRRRSAATRRPSRSPRVALVSRGLRLPRAPRACYPGRPARSTEPRLRDRDAGRSRARRGTGRAFGHRQRADPDQVSRAGAARPAGAVGGRLPHPLSRGGRFGGPRTAVAADGRALGRRDRLLRVRRRSLSRAVP